jgi:hypothetical protein
MSPIAVPDISGTRPSPDPWDDVRMSGDAAGLLPGRRGHASPDRRVPRARPRLRVLTPTRPRVVPGGTRLLSLPLVCLTLWAGIAGAAPISAAEALKSLAALHAVLGPGLDFADYQRRLADTRIRFEQYAERRAVTVAEAETKTALSAAMNYHRFAQSLWAARLQRGGELSLASFDTLRVLLEHFPCGALESLVTAVMAQHQGTGAETNRAAIAVDRRSADRVVPVLWACASERVAEAKRIIAPRAR